MLFIKAQFVETYIAFLRGINVGGHRKMKMAAVKESFEKLGVSNVKTYLQSGNVVFQSEVTDTKDLEARLEQQLVQDFGFDVPVLIRQRHMLQQLLKDNPFANEENTKQLYFVLLKKLPGAAQISALKTLQFKHEKFYIKDLCVYLNFTQGYGTAKLNTNLIEQKLQVAATARNLRTLEKMIALAQ